VWINDAGANSYITDHSLSGAEQSPNDDRVTTEDSVLENGKLKRMSYGYDQYNNVTSINEYDFGTDPNPGTLKRRTDRTYANGVLMNGYCYSNLSAKAGSCSSAVSTDFNEIIHMRRLLLTETITDGSTQEARTELEYDVYTSDGSHAPLITNVGMTMYNSNRFALFNPQFEPRGNVTKVRRWIAGTTYAESYSQYDNAGNVVKVKDPLGRFTQISYSDNYGDGTNPDVGAAGPNGSTFAFPTTVTNALSQVTKNQYNYTRGAPTGMKDPNLVITRAEYNDPYDRPTRVTAGYGLTGSETSMTEMSYPTASANESKVSKQMDGTRWLSSRTQYDGFGRPVLSSQSEDGLHYSTASFTIHSKTVYDPLGRVKFVTNPYRTAIDGWTRSVYDLGGRVTEVATFSGATQPPDSGTNANWTGSVVTTYASEVTTVRDQASKQRRSTVDGLGRLTKVEEMEPYPSSTVYATTNYGYDARGNLKTVSQSAQSRSFFYDGLSRLTSASNPESETITYGYDLNSNLTSKLDARGITTNYGYDVLNRATSRTYTNDPNGTPSVSYVYDTATKGIGRLASVTATGVSTTAYTTYDALGRVTAYNQQTAGQTYTMSAVYNKAGLMTDETYPSSRVVHTEYDGAGRVAGVKNQATGLYYAGAVATDSVNRIQYTPHGAASVMKLGNGLWEHTTLNSRLQPTQIGLGTSSTNSGTMELDYTYGTGAGSDNNGNVVTQTITVGASVMLQSYIYDRVNRLLTASESVSGVSKWTQTFGYDVYGNRTSLTNTGTDAGWLPPPSAPSVNAANNRFTSPFVYDQAGNVTTDNNGNVFGYDAENHQKSCTVAGLSSTYSYDGDGHRVKKVVGTGGSAVTTVFVYNASGQMIAEYNTPDQPVQGGGGTSYLTSDHLGSTRVVTNSTGVVKARHDYLPFGEEISANVSGRTTGMGYSVVDGVRQKFTQKERDSESGLDYFLARYYSSAQGKFVSADSVAGSTANPQSLNLYVYGYQNPLKFIDPTGHLPDLSGLVFFSPEAYQQYQEDETLSAASFGIYPVFNEQTTVLPEFDQIVAGAPDASLLGTISASIGNTFGVGIETAITADHTPTGPQSIVWGGMEMYLFVGGMLSGSSAGSLLDLVVEQATQEVISAEVDEVLTRYASGPESATRLERGSEESLLNPEERIHGVSVTASPADPARPHQSLPRSTVEAQFPVHNTPLVGVDPLHRTVETPHPVTKEVASKWNKLWGFVKKLK
jgi:RHS repeat-associated protein